MGQRVGFACSGVLEDTLMKGKRRAIENVRKQGVLGGVAAEIRSQPENMPSRS